MSLISGTTQLMTSRDKVEQRNHLLKLARRDVQGFQAAATSPYGVMVAATSPAVLPDSLVQMVLHQDKGHVLQVKLLFTFGLFSIF